MFKFLRRLLGQKKKDEEINVQIEIDKLKATFLWRCEVRAVNFYGLGGVSVKNVELPMFRVIGYSFTVPYGSYIRVTVRSIYYGSNIKSLAPVNPHLKIHDHLHIDYDHQSTLI